MLELVFNNLKQHIPDLTSQSLQSQKTKNESPTPHGRDSRETKSLVLADKGTSDCSDPNTLFTNGENNDKSEIPAANRDAFDAGVYNIQEAHAPSITGTGDFDFCVDLFGDGSQNLQVDWTKNLPSPYASSNTVTRDSGITNYATGSKRKLDLHDNGDQRQFIPSKRQNNSPESNALLLTNQVNDTIDVDWESVLADLMTIEPGVIPNDNCVSDSNYCAHEADFSDTELKELDMYLSDEFIYGLSKQDSLQSGFANSS